MTRTHGIAATYRHGCRCGECRAAHTADVIRRAAARAIRIAADPGLAPHGLVSTYHNWGCRCDPCTDAHSQACKDYYRRKAGVS